MGVNGDPVRAVRGRRTRAEMARYLYDTTGVGVSEQMLSVAERGGVAYRMPIVVRALILAYPELARVFLSNDIIERILDTFGRTGEEMGDGGNDAHESGDRGRGLQPGDGCD
ncbi:MAG: hypothetical protein M0R22_11275, partial [Dehalococcoidia bacterium]|nr:hypothetical protein [Dehalococcoidia bacterium]